VAMSRQELDTRARERAVSEHLHTFKVVGEDLYLVRSRTTEPGAMHQVRTGVDGVVHCTCAGWEYRQSCTHAAAVTRRLERERKHSRPAHADDAMPIVSICGGRSQIFRPEAGA